MNLRIRSRSRALGVSSLVLAAALTFSACGSTAVVTVSAKAQLATVKLNAVKQKYVLATLLEMSHGQTIQQTGALSINQGAQKIVSGSDQMIVVYIGGLLYVQASKGFLYGIFHLTTAQSIKQAGKWALVSKTNAAYNNVLAGVTIPLAMSEFKFGARDKLTLGPVKQLNGNSTTSLIQQVHKTDVSAGGIETYYLSASRPHLLVEVDAKSSAFSSKLTFTKWGKKFNITAPTPTWQI